MLFRSVSSLVFRVHSKTVIRGQRLEIGDSKPETRDPKPHASCAGAAEPFAVEPFIGAVLFELEQRFVDRFSERALVGKHDTVVFFAKDRLVWIFLVSAWKSGTSGIAFG